jgi:hypothetical protein
MFFFVFLLKRKRKTKKKREIDCLILLNKIHLSSSLETGGNFMSFCSQHTFLYIVLLASVRQLVDNSEFW